MWGYGHGWMYGDGGLMILGWIWMTLVWLIPLLLLVALLKYLFGGSRSGDKAESLAKTPLEQLQEIYARGEISREEFLQRQADLQK